ncbi:MAG: DUF2286 domain-containing protein [Thermoprotei archaeon]
MDTLIIYVNDGKIVKSERRSDDLNKNLKQIVSQILNEWNPEISDFAIVRDEIIHRFKLPLNPKKYEIYSKFNLTKEGNEGLIAIPAYITSYESILTDDRYIDKKLAVITYYVDEEVEKTAIEYAENLAKEEKEEESATEEDLGLEEES